MRIHRLGDGLVPVITGVLAVNVEISYNEGSAAFWYLCHCLLNAHERGPCNIGAWDVASHDIVAIRSRLNLERYDVRASRLCLLQLVELALLPEESDSTKLCVLHICCHDSTSHQKIGMHTPQ